MLLCGDGGMPASSLPKIFDKIATADIVVPYCENLREIKGPGRYLLSRTYTLLLNTLFGLRLKYYNGLPVHRVELVRSVGGKSDGFRFQAEILVQLLRAGQRDYVEVGALGAEKAKPIQRAQIEEHRQRLAHAQKPAGPRVSDGGTDRVMPPPHPLSRAWAGVLTAR